MAFINTDNNFKKIDGFFGDEQEVIATYSVKPDLFQITTFDNESLSDIIESLLYPYVAFNFSSFTTTEASGTFEYGTAKSITAVKPTYTKGSKDLTNMKVGTTSGGSNLYNSSVPNSGTSISLSTPL